ncbi:unnamed protein product [Allacma fusca]|uniref:Arf-GAP domain-containing protein n=1 Tax=Allacma fusca TaxID=39272 RepID=A0A8J2K7G2_9HEXA|nr:unnamed protein product [Allacma fusca]
MTDDGPRNKGEIQEIFRRLRNVSSNRVCFDCNAKNPTWSSVTYGVFICIDCSAVHRSLGVHLSFVRSTQLDTTWTWTQLRSMQLGGNANASTFFIQHNCTSNDAQQKYNSRAAQLYREKLSQMVSKYNKIHGNKIVFESDEGDGETERDVDFFDEMHSVRPVVENLPIDNMAKLNMLDKDSENQSTTGPNVEAALRSEPSSSGPRKSTIGQRKPANKLGAKKAGIGAQKVKADFSEIEREAQMIDQMREKQDEEARAAAERRSEEEERSLVSMRLAYQDLGKQQQQRQDKLKTTDPKKADQVERLGMGIGIRSGVSHSAISDMKTIDQESPSTYNKQPSGRGDRKAESFFDDFEIIGDSSSYGLSSGFSTRKSSDWDFEKPRRRDSDDEIVAVSKPKTREPVSSISSSGGGGGGGVGDEAQKKFGNAKAISSEQFFCGGQDADFERRTNLTRFEGSTSISSADYFGDGRQRNLQSQSSLSTLQNVDLDDVKESVRQGVTKVAVTHLTISRILLIETSKSFQNYSSVQTRCSETLTIQKMSAISKKKNDETDAMSAVYSDTTLNS